MQKVDGIQAARVSLKDGLTILDLKPGNHVTVTQLRQIIKNNGFVSKEASILASGRPDGAVAFIVAGTNERVTVSTPPQAAAGDWRILVGPPKP